MKLFLGPLCVSQIYVSLCYVIMTNSIVLIIYTLHFTCKRELRKSCFSPNKKKNKKSDKTQFSLMNVSFEWAIVPNDANEVRRGYVSKVFTECQ